ncbi:PEP-CTERM sorting domain-containing protein [Roseateles sp. DC23W]|uniref:PEP-CTERM sorting domain-containing protein n=1 Tax=Pelomonas dachongensis TaxID=3299029 RepID=A0ABW7ETW7_9BURK
MKHHLLAAALVAAFAAAPAQAVTLTSSSGAAVTSYSSGSLLAYDLDFTTLGTASLTFTLDAADIGSTLSFNALVRNLSGLGIDGVTMTLTGASFGEPGSIATDGFQAITASGSSAQQAWARFSPGLTTDLYLGAPLGEGTNWTINLAGAQAGGSFTIAVAVPEPETYALMLAGMALVGVAARRAHRVKG